MLLLLLACTGKDAPTDVEDTDVVDDSDCTLSTFYVDEDGDGFGVDAYEACEGDSTQGGDCNDADANVHPGKGETCDEVDQDCDGAVDEGAQVSWWGDQDGDGFGSEEAWGCSVPSDAAGEGGDCDDDAVLVYPDAVEYCDETDNDCDESVDEGATATWTLDEDGDGFGDPEGEPVQACSAPSGYGTPTDCDDDEKLAFPGATEDCGSSIDEDCDGLLSCEDGDCEGVVGCVEGDCDDDVDGDDDGATDCADDECWGDTVCIEDIGVVVTGGQYVFAQYGGSGSSSVWFGASSMSGQVVLYGVSHTSTCSWSGVYASGWGYTGYWGSSNSFYAPSLTLSSGCAISGADFPSTFTVGSTFGVIRHSQGRMFVPTSAAYTYQSWGSSYLAGNLQSGDVWLQ